MPHSIFMQKEIQPDDQQLMIALGATYPFWEIIKEKVKALEPYAIENWHFSGVKFGWSFRMSDEKRVLIYLLPREGYFKVAFVFGDKAVETITHSDIDPKIVKELLEAKKYAEGRGIRLDVREEKSLAAIMKLLEIKIKGLVVGN